MSETQNPPMSQQLLFALFDQEERARAAVENLIAGDFPMDQISLLGKAQGSGDDSLGIYYPNVGERMKGWGAMGAFWGGLWGLLTGAAGLFIVPGLGPVFAAGPVVQIIANTLAGAGVAGGIMAGTAALSQFSVAMHRMGVPEEKLQSLQQAIEQGQYLIILRLGPGRVDHWRKQLAGQGAVDIQVYPYRKIT